MVRESWLFGLSGAERDARRAEIQEIMDRHRSVLNRLDPHLGCVTCRGPLRDGHCSVCDTDPQGTDWVRTMKSPRPISVAAWWRLARRGQIWWPGKTFTIDLKNEGP